MTADLVAFLRARLDEDAAVARACAWDDSGSLQWTAHHRAQHDGRWVIVDGMDEGVTDVRPHAADDRTVAQHIARHDPARVLAEVEAKREILRGHGRDHECIQLTGSGEHSAVDGKPWELWESEHSGDAERACWVVRQLAAPYRDHPDYDEAWKP